MDDRVETQAAARVSRAAGGELIAIVDIGKTNTKLVLLEAGTGRIAWHAEQPIEAIAGRIVRQLDVAGIERWLLQTIASAPGKERIRTIVPIAHGAAAVLVDKDRQVIAVPDYEDPVFDSVADEYRKRRDDFATTYSPWLPLGLNLGRQLYFLQHRQPEEFANVVSILTFPQYWAARLCGVEACEVTSLGCHTDLWQPTAARFSPLLEREGWSRLLPPLRAASDTLGTITSALAATTGLDPRCRVLCGIHDSNASYLAHAASHRGNHDLAVISSGTWTVIMADRGSLDHLDESRDMLANVDAFGAPVGTARFMGGREYAAIAGQEGGRVNATLMALHRVLDASALALPCFAPAGGPFAGHAGRFINGDRLSAEDRAALATLYVALMTDLRLDELRAGNTIVVDGPLAANPLFASVLRSLRPDAQVSISDSRLASCSAAHFLATGQLLANTVADAGQESECSGRRSARAATTVALDSQVLLEYRQRWRHEVEELG